MFDRLLNTPLAAVCCLIPLFKIKILTTANYRGRFGQHRPCYNTEMARPVVLKQILSQVLCEREFIKIWSVKSTVYLLKSNLINLLMYLLVTTLEAISWGIRSVIFRLKKRFQIWKQIYKALSRVQSFHKMNLGRFLHTRFLETPNVSVASKTQPKIQDPCSRNQPW